MNILSVTGLSSDLVIDALKEKTKGQDSLEALKLKDNQILVAKVLKVFSQTQAQLLIAGQKLMATTQMPLSENETLVLKVARSEGKQILRRVEPAPVSQQSEGISEMRALGREGPFAKLSDILNTTMPGEIPEPMASEDLTSDPLMDKGLSPSPKDLIKLPSGDQIKTPQPLSPGMEKTIDKTMESSLKDLARPLSSEQNKTLQPMNPGIDKTIASEKVAVFSFAQNSKIPFEFKLALLITGKPADTPPHLEKPLTELTRKLVESVSSQPDILKNSQTSLNQESLPARLEHSVKQMFEALSSEEKNMARQFMDNKSQSWEAKMAQVLLSGSPKAPLEAVATLKNMLVENASASGGFEKATLPLDAAAKDSPLSGASQTAPGSPVILKNDGKTDVLPVSNPNAMEPSDVMLEGSNKKSLQNSTLLSGQEVLSDKTAITRQALPAALHNDVPEVFSESPPSANIKRDLENIFTRLETSLEKQTGIFDQETAQTMALVKKIKDLVSSFTLRSEQPFDESTVKNLVRDSGLMWESKLKDLATSLPDKKGALTPEQAVKLIENDVKALALKGMGLEDGVKHNVSETLKTFTESLEKMQMLNSQASDDSGKYLLPLPYVHNGHIRFGQLLIDLDRKQSKAGEEKDRIIRVAFILDMSRLGPIQAGVSLYKKSMSGEFLVGNAEVKALVDEALPGLVDELAQKGYTVKKMECRLTDPEALAGMNLVEKLVDPRDGSVSIRI